MHAGIKIKNEYGVSMILEKSRPFKFLGSFRTRADSSDTFIKDDRLIGKSIAIIPTDIKLISSGSNNMYLFPSEINIVGNEIQWKYEHLKIDIVTGEFHGVKDANKGADSIYEVTFSYGYY